ncbi:hypothetical protein KJ786_00980 [Patescibacteria group bacterium]|nr:hypothetical protein [Patescibacteria group bacterium]
MPNLDISNSNNKKQRVVFSFPEEIDSIDVFSNILKENGLQETIEEAYEKLMQEKPSRITTINDATKSFVGGNISENDFILLLQNQLEISKEKAENLIKSTKEKIIPFTKKIVIKEEATTNERVMDIPKTFPPIFKKEEEYKLEIKRKPIPSINQKPRPNIKSQNIKKQRNPMIEKNMENGKNPKQSDVYREPIE